MLINENTVPHINNRSTKSTHLNIITTADGSDSIKNCDLNVSYHSEHGAIQESKHIFIQSGLHDYLNRYQHHTVSILEIGFGTGLNALLSLLYSAEHHISIHYHTIEPDPICVDLITRINYPKQLQTSPALFKQLHDCSWQTNHHLSPHFYFSKYHSIQEIDHRKRFDIIFYDPFCPTTAPQLWTETAFSKMYSLLTQTGILVTYSSKGSVKRALKGVGFQLERLTGPPGKRHIIRANKDLNNLPR